MYFIYLIDQNTDILNIIYNLLIKILSVERIDFDILILGCVPYFLDLFLFYKYTKINIFIVLYCHYLYIHFMLLFLDFIFNILQYYNLIY